MVVVLATAELAEPGESVGRGAALSAEEAGGLAVTIGGAAPGAEPAGNKFNDLLLSVSDDAVVTTGVTTSGGISLDAVEFHRIGFNTDTSVLVPADGLVD